MSTSRYRFLLLLLGLALIAVVVGAVVFTPSGRDTSLPDAVEGYSPADGSTVLRQTQIVIDLEPGYDIDLRIDDTPIPESEIDVVEATGVFRWAPDTDSTFAELTPGLHVVEVAWQRTSGLPDPGALVWSFRVQ